MGKAAFDLALEAWRKTRSPRFAALADAIASIEPARETVGTSGKKADSAKWFAVAELGDWRDLPRLVATLTAGNSPQALERVKKLAERDDPRLVPALLAIAADPPYTAGTSRKFWQQVVTALEASRDPRARDGMRDLSRRYKTINDTHMGAWVAAAMSKAAERIPEPDALDAEEQASLTALEIQFLGEVGATKPRAKPKPSTSPEEMFAAIVEAPDDDDARLVYADLLAEQGQGDRAELIVLQIERATGRGSAERADLERTKFTLTSLLKEWAAPVSAAADEVHFDRGFPHRVVLAGKGLAHVADAVEWGTVRILEHVAYAPAKAIQAFFDSAHAKNLTAVSALPPRWLDRLRAPIFPWTHVGLINEKLLPSHLARFPRLTHLEILRGGVDASLFAAAPALESVEMDDVSDTDGAHLFVANPKLARLVLGRNARPEAFAGLALTDLSVKAEIAVAARFLRACPTVKQLYIHQREQDLSALVDLFGAYPLERVGFTFRHGAPGARLERKDGALFLVGAPGPRWGRYYDELAEAAATLAGRVANLVLYPERPRHQGPPLGARELESVRSAWPALEVREWL